MGQDHCRQTDHVTAQPVTLKLTWKKNALSTKFSFEQLYAAVKVFL